MFVRIGFEVDTQYTPDLRYKLELEQLPANILSLIEEAVHISATLDAPLCKTEVIYWKVMPLRQVPVGPALAAALRLVWRVHRWTALHGVVRIVGVHVYG